MRIMIAGAGAMGATFSGVLAENGADVWLADGWAEHVAAIRDRGHRLAGTGGRTVRVRATLDPAEAGPAGLVILFVKSWQTDATLRAVLPAAGPGAVVLTLQNGYGHHRVVAAAAGPGRTLIGTTVHPAVLDAPGRVTHAHAAGTTIGEPEAGAASRTSASPAV